MQYRIFKRNIYEDRKTDWEDTGDVIEAEMGNIAIDKWIAKWIYEHSPAATCPESYEVRLKKFGENCCWMKVRDLNADPLSEDEYFKMELAVRVA